MSVEYDVRINNSIYNGFETFLEQWLKQSGFENSSINKTDDSKKYFVFSKGSIRGLVITKVEKFLKKDLHIRLSSLSSKSDWLMLYSLIDYINLKNKTKVLEEGKILERSTINKEYFLRMAEDDQKAGFNLVKTREKDSGWYLGLVNDEDNSHAIEDYQCIYVFQLLKYKPQLLQLLFLPVGYLVVINGDTIEEVIDKDDKRIL
ncbi:MAG: hypothetical protein BWY74_00529 [Firmicutes bacterium ADurb.Bin419]|nr:MAG: hypothetical protein BWY74_00529 [Firmicutes bacterium ADurb.Bin419]